MLRASRCPGDDLVHASTDHDQNICVLSLAPDGARGNAASRRGTAECALDLEACLALERRQQADLGGAEYTRDGYDERP